MNEDEFKLQINIKSINEKRKIVKERNETNLVFK
jgi:hypothetical protein